jgi:hypothetical protein
VNRRFSHRPRATRVGAPEAEAEDYRLFNCWARSATIPPARGAQSHPNRKQERGMVSAGAKHDVHRLRSSVRERRTVRRHPTRSHALMPAPGRGPPRAKPSRARSPQGKASRDSQATTPPFHAQTSLAGVRISSTLSRTANPRERQHTTRRACADEDYRLSMSRLQPNFAGTGCSQPPVGRSTHNFCRASFATRTSTRRSPAYDRSPHRFVHRRPFAPRPGAQASAWMEQKPRTMAVSIVGTMLLRTFNGRPRARLSHP